MSRTRVLVIAAAVLVAFLVSGTLWARSAVVKKGDKTIRIDAEGLDLLDLADIPGLALAGELPPEAIKTVLTENLKFRKETKELRNQLEGARSELDLLWLDDEPNAEKIVAKMKELDKLKLELREKEIRNRFATAQLLPEKLRTDYLRNSECGSDALGKALRFSGKPGEAAKKLILKLKRGPHGIRCECLHDDEEDD